MQRVLIVVGCSRKKLDSISKSDRNKLLDFAYSGGAQYDSVLSIIRVKTNGDKNFQRSGDTLAESGLITTEYHSDDIITVSGYDVDCSKFRKDIEYHIMGISTAASVLTIAMSMYSNGFNVRVLSDYCIDRKGKKLHENALDIMKAYMPNCVI